MIGKYAVCYIIAIRMHGNVKPETHGVGYECRVVPTTKLQNDVESFAGEYMCHVHSIHIYNEYVNSSTGNVVTKKDSILTLLVTKY